MSCGDRVTIAVIPVCRIADREINLGRYLRVASVVALLKFAWKVQPRPAEHALDRLQHGFVSKIAVALATDAFIPHSDCIG